MGRLGLEDFFTMRFTNFTSVSLGCLLAAGTVLAHDHPDHDREVPRDPAVVIQRPGQSAGLQLPPTGTLGLAFTKTHVDIGMIDEGATPEIVFAVRNTSDRTVELLDVRTSCGCTAKSNKNPTRLLAGEEATLRVSFDSKGRRGVQSKAVTVITDEFQNASYNLSFTTKVVSPVFVEPNSLDFGTVEEGTAKSVRFSVFVLDSSYKLNGIESNDPNVEITLAETKPFEEEGRQGLEYIYDATLPPTYPTGNLVARALIKTTPEQEFLSVILRGRVVGDISITPARAMGVVSSGETTTRTVTLKSRGGIPFEIVSMELPENDRSLPIKLSHADGATPGEKEVVATFRGEGQPQTRQTRVLVKVRSGEAKTESTVEVPVVMVHRPGAVGVAPLQPQPGSPAINAKPTPESAGM